MSRIVVLHKVGEVPREAVIRQLSQLLSAALASGLKVDSDDIFVVADKKAKIAIEVRVYNDGPRYSFEAFKQDVSMFAAAAAAQAEPSFQVIELDSGEWKVKYCPIHGLISPEPDEVLETCPAPSKEHSGQCGIPLSAEFTVQRVPWWDSAEISAPPKSYGNPKLDMLVEELVLDARAYNVLKRRDMHRVGDVTSWSRAEIAALPGMGKVSVNQLIEALKSHGLSLAE